MAKQVLSEVEARFQAPIKTILEGFVEEGINKSTAAERLGIVKNTLLSWIKKHDVDWPIYTKEHKKKRTKNLRERCLYEIEHNGKTKPLFDAAKEENINYKVVLERYKKGDRGEHLFRPVRSYRSQLEGYELDISEEDLLVACDLAKAIGTKRAAKKFNIPMGALSLAINGKMEQLKL